MQFSVFVRSRIPNNDIVHNSVNMIIASKMYPDMYTLIDKLIEGNCDTIMSFGACGDEIEDYADEKELATHPNGKRVISTLSFQNDPADDAANIFEIFNSFESGYKARNIFVFDETELAKDFIRNLKKKSTNIIT